MYVPSYLVSDSLAMLLVFWMQVLALLWVLLTKAKSDSAYHQCDLTFVTSNRLKIVWLKPQVSLNENLQPSHGCARVVSRAWCSS